MSFSEGKYVDGFVLVVPKDNIEEYKKMAGEACKFWMECGALDYRECRGEDMAPDTHGAPILTFPKLTEVGPDETVWFSFITYKSREHRDEVNAQVMKKMKEKGGECKEGQEMPFDMKRMAWGGFQVEVSP